MGRVLWRLCAIRSADQLVDRILPPGVNEGARLVDCGNANRFTRGAEPCRGVLLSRCLTAASRGGDFSENKILLDIGQSCGLCSHASYQWLDLRPIGIS